MNIKKHLFFLKNKVNLFFLFTLGFCLLFFTIQIDNKPAGDNDLSRLAGVISVAKYNELNIDKTIQKVTVDKVIYEGKYYSSKPPLMNFLLGKMVKAVLSIKPEWLQNDIPMYKTATALGTVVPLLGIFILFVYVISEKFKRLNITRILFGLYLIFGTLLFSYSKNLTNHVLEAFLQTALFFVLIQKAPWSNKKFMIIGFLMSALFAIDVTFGFVAIAATSVFLLATFSKEKISNKNLLTAFFHLLLGFIPIALAHFYLSYRQFGILLPPQLYPQIYLNYPGSNWVGENIGTMEMQNAPFMIRIFNYTFGTHGLFLYQPILLIPFLRFKNYKKFESLYIFGLAIIYILFLSATSPNYGGASYAARRLLPLIPLLYYLVIRDFSHIWKAGVWQKSLLVASFIFTLCVSILGYVNPWNNWDLLHGSQKNIYFPLLYTLKKVFHWPWIESLAIWLEPRI